MSSRSRPKTQPKYGKYAFFAMFFVLVILFGASFLFLPPKFKKCSTETGWNDCGCPLEDKYIGTRNVILVDLTDSLAAGKKEDVARLIEQISFKELPLLDWVRSGKKTERTSIYLLTDTHPAEMTPVVSLCAMPPGITWLVSEYSETQEREIKQGSQRAIGEAITRISSTSASSHSHIVEGLATATSNASSWTPGGQLVLISDLYENSSTCGFFEKTEIPSYQRIPTQCKRAVDLLGSNLKRSYLSSSNSTVAICQILTKPLKPGLLAFWREMFQEQLGYDILLSCDPWEIKARTSFLNR